MSPVTSYFGLFVTGAAKAFGVPRPALLDLLNQTPVSPGETALRIEKAFGVNMDTVMRMQATCGITQARMDVSKVRLNCAQAPCGSVVAFAAAAACAVRRLGFEVVVNLAPT